jgi:hypothetical protein
MTHHTGFSNQYKDKRYTTVDQRPMTFFPLPTIPQKPYICKKNCYGT